MIRHVFTLIWNRKRANALIVLELLVTFLILFALAGFSLNLYRLYGKPLGFNVANTWSVRITTGGAWSKEDDTTFHQLVDVVNQMPEVQKTELMFDQPFDIGGSATSMGVGQMSQETRVGVNIVSPGFPEAVGMRLIAGRWFGPEDDNQSAENETIIPILVNRVLSDMAGEDVIGALVPYGPTAKLRIVGMFDSFRQHGQFSSIQPFMLQRARLDGSYFEAPSLVLILSPNVPAEFEEALLAALQRGAPDWDFDVSSWESLQETHSRLYLIPLMIVSGVVLFLLTMVGFGLLGVLWQNIIRRTPEMGLRRAMGATAGAVRLQVVLELLAVAALALVLGIAIVVQFPLAGVIAVLDWALFLPAVTISTLLLLLLCILFALYPGYQATRQDPVEALRYE